MAAIFPFNTPLNLACHKVGPALAARIVAYREQHGRFHRVDELDAVSGLGPASVEKLKPYIRIE